MLAIPWIRRLLLIVVCGTAAGVAQLSSGDAATDRALRHQSSEWLLVESHLPNPETGTPQALETAGDILRARRLPEDALEYYHFAIQRGGDEAALTNRIGLTWLELHHPEMAKIAFKRVVRLKPKEAQGWNNLGASEYITGGLRAAIGDYSKAVKLSKKTAIFHSNLGTAYFEVKDFDSARQQLALAVKLDRHVFQGGDSLGGVQAHVLSPSDRARFCFEMAKLAAKQHDDENMLRWLARATEAGFDARSEMAGDKDFQPYVKDPRIALILHNARAMRDGQIAENGLSPTQPPPAQIR